MHRAGTILASLLLTLSGCGKQTADWLADVHSKEVFTRTLAAAALGEAPEPDRRRAAIGLLRLRFDEASVRDRVVESLRRLAVRSPGVFVELLDSPPYREDNESLLDALVAAGDDAVPFLLQALQSDQPVNRTSLAVALGRLGQMSHPAVVRWVENGSVDELAVAIAGVAAAGRGRAAHNLALRLADRLDDDPRLRQQVLHAVERASRDSKLAAQAIISALGSRSGVDRQAMTGAVFAGLLEGWRRGNHDIRAAHALVKELRERAIPHLVDVLVRDNDKQTKQWAADALTDLGDSALRSMVQAGVGAVWIDTVASRLEDR